MKVLVCGGREFNDPRWMARVLDELNPDIVINGGANGADHLAREWAVTRYKAMWTFPANWDKHGKAAGPIRNREMLECGQPDMVVVFPGGRGTADMVRQAKAAGFQVIECSQTDAAEKPTTEV